MSDARGGEQPVEVGRQARILSIQVGTPREYGSSEGSPGRPWTSAIAKERVEGLRWVSRTQIAGDRQADLKHHGGVDKAVLAYSAHHYPLWREELPSVAFANGAFGENLTVDGVSEAEVAIGDVWSAGSVVFQVSQPRQPCWKLARHLGIPDMVVRVQSTLRSGWYLRVLEEGEIEPGAVMSLVARPHPAWSVAEASRVMVGVRDEPERALELAGLPELSASWKRTLLLRAGGGTVDTSARIDGPGSAE